MLQPGNIPFVLGGTMCIGMVGIAALGSVAPFGLTMLMASVEVNITDI